VAGFSLSNLIFPCQYHSINASSIPIFIHVALTGKIKDRNLGTSQKTMFFLTKEPHPDPAYKLPENPV
jgi:hypothetical protein